MGNPERKNVDATTNSDKTQQDSGKSQAQINWEKRFKDTQSAYTKSQQELKAVKAKLEALEKLAQPKVELDEATKAELDELKFQNPDQWYEKMRSLEEQAANKYRESLQEATERAKREAELEYRAQVLREFQKSHPDVVINDEVIAYDVPPRITQRLENGEISFEQYLEDVVNYLKAPKVVGDSNKLLGQPDLSNVGGDSAPSDSAVTKDIVSKYSDLIL